MAASENPLVSDRLVDFLLYEVLEVEALATLPDFEGHGRDTFDPWLATCRRLGRQVLYPAYRAMDAEPPRLENGRVLVHPKMHGLWKELAGAGVIAASRPFDVGGQSLPLTVATFANAYLMAGNLAAYGFAGLTTGAAHLLEAFGSEQLRETYMRPMYEGRYSGTMALTEPQAGSSLADVTSGATPTNAADGHYLIRGSKIFISGGDQDMTENVVHLVLARIDGAPAGTKGISLFAVPRLRANTHTTAPGDAGAFVPNDVHVTGLIHKIGWRGLPSLALSFGDAGDCHGFLVGEPHQGLKFMFQMMNEARIMVGVNAAATASVAFHESLAYAQDRRQGRAVSGDATRPQVALVEHADVRRMLLKQKAIVEGALCLLGVAARYSDIAEHGTNPDEKKRARLLLDLLTPLAKTFPAERGFEANALALQIHGGYGYSSEYPPESWLRDQKLNTIHEGTTGIQSMDLLGRKVVAGGGAALMALAEEIRKDLAKATSAGVEATRTEPIAAALDRMLGLTQQLAARGMAGDAEGMLAHAVDYLDAMSVVVVAWMWTKMSAAAGPRTDDFALGVHQATRYWVATEIPRVATLAALCESGERSFVDVKAAWL